MFDQLLKTYPAFRSRDFCLYFFGQGISFIGTWMQVVAQGWLMFHLTGSAFETGLVNFLGVIPVVAIALFGGTIVDKTSARFVLIRTSILGMLQAVLFYGLFATGHLSPAGICGMAFAWGIINGLDAPARYVCIMEIVSRDLVPSAKALNGFLVAIGFTFGPSIAGFVIVSQGVGATFFWNAVSFVPMLALIFMMKLKTEKKGGSVSVSSIIKGTADGVRLCARDAAMRPLMSLMGIAMFLGFSYRGMLPVVAEHLHLGPLGFGWLSAAPGIGVVAATFVVSRSTQALPVRKFLLVGVFTLGGALLTFSFMRSFTSGMVLLAVAGFGLDLIVLTVQPATAIITAQKNPLMIGRVIGCGASTFFLGNALGYLSIGTLSRAVGVFPAIGCFGAVLLFVAVVVTLRRERYPVVIKG